MLILDDILRVGESPEKMNSRLKERKEGLEDKGLKIGRGRTEYIQYDK